MRHLAAVLVLGGALVMAGSALGQPQSKADPKKLQAEIEKLRKQLDDLKGQLEKAEKEAEKEKPSTTAPFNRGKGRSGPFFGGFGKRKFGKGDEKSWEEFRKKMEEFKDLSPEERREQFEKAFGGKGFGRGGFGGWRGFGPPMGRFGDRKGEEGKGRPERPEGSGQTATADRTDELLQRVIRDLEALRRELAGRKD